MAHLETQLSLTLLDGGDSKMPRRAIAAGLNLASTGILLALLARTAMMFHLSIGALIAEAFVFSSLAYVWSLTASALISAIAPIPGHGKVSRATALASVWLAPAVILAAHLSPAKPLAAVFAVIVATRRICEEALDEDAGESARLTRPLLGGLVGECEAEPPVPAHALVFPIGAAAAAQGACAAILLQNVTIASVLTPLSAAALTSLFVARREPKAQSPAARHTRRAISGILAASAVTAAGLVAGIGYPESQVQTGNSPDIAARLLRTLSPGNTRGKAAPAANAEPDRLPVAVGSGDYPGVVLWPEIREVTLLVTPLPYRTGGWAAPLQPYGIPFGGEYWMYRPPSSRPPAGSYFRRGSPGTQAFHTTDGRPLVMEARQRLEQSLDLACCSAIELELSNAEPKAGAVSAELMVRGRRQAGARWGSLGQRDVLSTAGPKGRPAMERITFEIPADPVPRYFDEFRVVFHRRPEAADKSARIAIQRFVLVPRQ